MFCVATNFAKIRKVLRVREKINISMYNVFTNKPGLPNFRYNAIGIKRLNILM